MYVKHQHLCKMCSKTTNCFVFPEFSMLFSLCRPCYDELTELILAYPQEIDICSFCEQEKQVKKLSGFPDSQFFGNIFICSSCFQRMQNLIHQEKEEFE